MQIQHEAIYTQVYIFEAKLYRAGKEMDAIKGAHTRGCFTTVVSAFKKEKHGIVGDCWDLI